MKKIFIQIIPLMLIMFFLSQGVFGAFRSNRIHLCDETETSTTEGSSAREEVYTFDFKEETKRYWSSLISSENAEIFSALTNHFQKKVEHSLRLYSQHKKHIRMIVEELEVEGFSSLRCRLIHLKGTFGRDNISTIFEYLKSIELLTPQKKEESLDILIDKFNEMEVTLSKKPGHEGYIKKPIEDDLKTKLSSINVAIRSKANKYRVSIEDLEKSFVQFKFDEIHEEYKVIQEVILSSYILLNKFLEPKFLEIYNCIDDIATAIDNVTTYTPTQEEHPIELFLYFLACFYISQSNLIDEPFKLSEISDCIIDTYHELTRKKFFWDQKTSTRKTKDKTIKVLTALDWKVNISKEEFEKMHPQYSHTL
jgi:hypothetical protein